MSFSPNNNQQTGTHLAVPSVNNNSQQDTINVNYHQSGIHNIEQIAGGNNWLLQQNWQQQNMSTQQQQMFTTAESHQQNFFDSIPISSETLLIPPAARNSLESKNVDGWGDWDDWSSTDLKQNKNPIKNHQNSVNLIQEESKLIPNIANIFPDNINWQNNLSPSHNYNHPLEELTQPFDLSIATSPLRLQTDVISTPSVQTADSILSSAKSSTATFVNSGQHQMLITKPVSILGSPNVLNAMANQEVGVLENLEVFKEPQIILPNMYINDASCIPPAPHMFHNFPEKEENPPPMIQSQLQDNASIAHEVQFYSSNLNHQPLVKNVLEDRKKVFQTHMAPHQIAISAIQKPPVQVQRSTYTGTGQFPSISNVSEASEDRKLFLTQEDIGNERENLFNKSERQENLLPPPIAYQQPTVNDDRNQYLQTSHLSEDDFVVLNNPTNDDDINLPPPGLSRFVLGEPEHTADSERHADGEDDNAIQPPPASISSETSRNLYSFSTPIDLQVQRVVTGVESMSISQTAVITMSQQVESRELDLDGENIEDQPQVVKLAREKPTIGGDLSSKEPEVHIQATSNIPDVRNLSNSSTGNESDHHHRNDNKKYLSKSGKGRHQFDSEDDSEGSSDRDRFQHREKDKRRRNNLRGSDEGEYCFQKSSKKREEKSGHNRYDDSRYETEESTRYDRSGKSHDQKDRDRKYEHDFKRGGNNRRSYKVGDRGERRGDRENRERSERERNHQEDNRDRRRNARRHYDESYLHQNRKNNNSRSARDSDYERDSRYKLYNMYGGYNYDPYAYYHQHQQYFEQLRKTNPQSYAEWYRKYYSQMQGDALSGADCRESVHSGRSSAAGRDKDRPENLSNVEGRSMAQGEEDLQPGRSTPHKFLNDHAVISFNSCVLVSVKPKYSHSNGLQNIAKLMKIAPNDSTKKMFQSFSGPLVKGITHKKTVIEYCEERIKLGPISSRLKSCQSSSNSLQSICSTQSNQSSYVLLWNLLVLLLRQNGVVVGTDIAELLVKNQNIFPYEERFTKNYIDKEIKESGESNTSEVEEGGANESIQVSSDDKSQVSDNEITDKFRNYLLYGNVNEALEWATDNSLWGHALFLASKVDKRLHANVMMKFANKLNLNDPLQTLYQLMSGRCPSSVTNVQDEKWGDWRPHLAMIISNTTQSPDLNRKAITTLGDSLLSRGDLFSAQFCYLMAQVGFGKLTSSVDSLPSANIVRLVLLGSSHIKTSTFLEFATNEAIIMTEIYEYACSLNDEAFTIVEFQPYKFLLSCRLLDYGFHLKALMYLEQIYVHIQYNPSRYEASFINKVYELADKLKFYDPVMEKTFADHNEGQLEDPDWLKNFKALYKNCQISSELQTQYDPLSYNQQQHHHPPILDNGCYESALPTVSENDSLSVKQSHDVTQPDNFNKPNQHFNASTNDFPEAESHGTYYQHLQPYEIKSNDQQTQIQQSPLKNEDQFQPDLNQTTFAETYDYYNPSTSSHPSQEQSSTPSISMPNSGSGPKRSIFDEEDVGNVLNQNDKSQQQREKIVENQTSSQTQKQGHPSTLDSGWFGGIWNKFSGKPKNQMILPDDKNPKIVWDSEKKKWINTDEGEDSQEHFVPPPKMADIVSQLQQHPIQAIEQPQPTLQKLHITQPQTSGCTLISAAERQIPVKSSGLQSNMFKMQRNRTLKKSYVDVFNPSGATTKSTDNIMAPSLPPLPQSGFMVPAVSDDLQDKNQRATQFYDPNTYTGNYQ